jgi:diketogulonate reductase-like aldo/keto reductase
MSFAAASGAPLGAGATRMPGTGVGTQRDVRARSTAPSSASAAGTTSVRLSSQATQPMVGLGTWQAPKGQVRDAVKAALETGYVHLDCAAAYANEDEVGEALEDAFARGVATRADLFVTSKLWNDRRRPEDVRAGLLQTLKDLRLEYLDLYLIHWPVCWRRGTLMQDDADASILECWRELERCVDEGLIRSIGVSNFSRPKLEELIRDARVKPAVNQIESHPLLPNTELVRWCQSNDIAVTAYSPLAQGRRGVHGFHRGIHRRQTRRDTGAGAATLERGARGRRHTQVGHPETHRAERGGVRVRVRRRRHAKDGIARR